jgi:hypothetical protein
MRLRLASIAALMSTMLVPAASAQLAGTVKSISGEIGNVIIVRDGEIYALAEGDYVIVGDVISTRRGAGVELSLADCTLRLGSLEQIEIRTTSCPTGRVRVESTPSEGAAPPEVTVVNASSGAGSVLGGLSTSSVLLGVAGIATVAALAAGGGGDDSPVSP